MLANWQVPGLDLDELVEPAFLHAPDFKVSLGEEVSDFAESIDFAPDPEQRLWHELSYGIRPDGTSAVFETAVICARQNLKTGAMMQAALADLFLMDQELIIWTAHEFSTTGEAFRDIVQMIDANHDLARRVAHIRTGSGKESIELLNGHRMLFKARTNHGGRGLSCDRLYLDEAFALTNAQIGAILPSMSARPDPRITYGSSAGQMNSHVLRRIRDRGREQRPGRLAYLEWCAARQACESPTCSHEPDVAVGCQLDVRSNWIEANPLVGRVRTNGTGMSLETIEGERATMDPHEFARERLGWWDDPGGVSIFPAEKWEAGKRAARPPQLKVQALAVAVSYDLQFSAIAAAGLDEDDNTWGKILRHGPGTGWVTEYAKALQDQFEVSVVADSKGPAAALIPLMETAGVTMHVATTQDVLDAFSRWDTRVKAGTFLYEDQEELNEAVRLATTRPIGDRMALGRKAAGADISPAEAIMLAGWMAESGPKPIRSAYEDGGLMTV